ncbi:MAG: hypothetical protein LBR58_03795 [Propionibacteriaceae bacterium]|jgi:hypothetical protein|nr:hypothetical protein [Propionibacteriaceae bacterium]
MAVLVTLACSISMAGCAPAKELGPKEVVEAYLQAIADGHATDALSYDLSLVVLRYGEPGPLLTDAVLAESRELAPMAVVTVSDPELDGLGDAEVVAQYKLGDEMIEHTFELSHHDAEGADYKPGWYLSDTSTNVWLESDDWTLHVGDGSAIGLNLSGVPVDPSSHVTLFPGVYQLSVSNPGVVLTGGEFTVWTTSSALVQTPVEASLSLTDGLQERIGQEAQKMFEACLNQPLAVTTCGFGMEGLLEAGVDESTIKWEMVDERGQDSGTPGFDMSTWEWCLRDGLAMPTGAEYGSDIGAYELRLKSAKMKDGSEVGRSVRGTSTLQVTSPCVDISDPDYPKMTFADTVGTLQPDTTMTFC